jgi:hypothetical protein
VQESLVIAVLSGPVQRRILKNGVAHGEQQLLDRAMPLGTTGAMGAVFRGGVGPASRAASAGAPLAGDKRAVSLRDAIAAT